MVKRQEFKPQCLPACDRVPPGELASEHAALCLRGDPYHAFQAPQRCRHRCDLLCPVEPLSPIAVTIRGNQDLGPDLAEPVNDRRGAEVWGAARPNCSDGCAREERDNGLLRIGKEGRDPVSDSYIHLLEIRCQRTSFLLELLPTHDFLTFPFKPGD